MTYHCQICDYKGDPEVLPCACEIGHCTEEAPGPGCAGPTTGCPVCKDGRVDPWSLIREIRSRVGSLPDVLAQQLGPFGPARRAAAVKPTGRPGADSDRPTDPFAGEWDLLQISITSIWSDLTLAELTAARGDRVRFEGLLRRKYGYGTALAHQLTNGLLDLHERFNGRWEVVGECVPKHWPRISAAEVTRMNGTIEELSGLIERRYDLAPGHGRRQVAEFLDQIDYRLLVSLFRESTKPANGEIEPDGPNAGAKLQREAAS